jgi:hypothetical protein
MTGVATAIMGTTPAFATKPEPLDAEFLDYLAACEGKDDNWTVVAKQKPRPKAQQSAPVKETPPPDQPKESPEPRP